MANTFSLGRRSITIVPDGSTDIDVASIQSNKLLLTGVSGDFTVGETVVQATSDAMGVVNRWDLRQKLLYLDQMAGTFDITNPLTGGTSGAFGTPSEVQSAFPDGIRLSDLRFTPSAAGDILVVRGKGLATGPELFKLFANSAREVHGSIGGKSWREKIYIVAAECTFADAEHALIVLEYD